MATGTPKRGRAGRIAAAALALLTAAAGAAPLRAAEDEPGRIQLSGGAIGVLPSDRNDAGYFAFEYRAGPAWELWRVRPSFGLAATMDASVYGWTALSLDIFFGSRVVLTPSTGVGLYGEGDGQDLGSTVVFRNGAELAWRFDDRARLGIGMHYLANFGLGDEDPGTMSMTVFYAHPLESLLP